MISEPLRQLQSVHLYQQVEDVDRTVVELINQRRKKLVRHFRKTHTSPVIDSYHGEMGFPLHPDAANAVAHTMRALVDADTADELNIEMEGDR